MRRLLPLLAVPALIAAAPPAAPDPAARAERWWADIASIAGDDMEGRQTGSAGYLRAAERVKARFRQIGLAPAGVDGGFEQPVAFEQQRIDYPRTSAELVGPGGRRLPLAVPGQLIVTASGSPRPATVDAPLVFAGYGLHLPELGWDDLKGLDLRGKIAVVISGGPADLPGPAKAANRSARNRFLHAAGAIGVLAVTTPGQIEIPWARQVLLAPQPGLYLADAALRETPDGFFAGTLDPEQAARLFAGAPQDFAALAALADAGRPVPTFPLASRLRATIAAERTSVTSPNLVARLEGTDPRLRAEHVVLSAHLDHLGVGAPIAGDRIYNGAMDDASGVASVLDIAEQLARGPRPKRSMLFVIVTAEEKGLLGSTFFARRPTVPAGSIVADLNFDMPLPLWPLRSVLVQGEAESTLGAAARAVAAAQGLRLVPDPLPDRNSFTRTDQFSFVKAGIPALAFKFGFERDTPEFRIEHDWRANRYHSPSDDLAQPGVLRAEAIRLDDYVAALARAVADGPARPAWLPTSVFRAGPQ